ncbi:MAG: hypothetical protein WC477_02310 [Patescibacteria group bacterium]
MSNQQNPLSSVGLKKSLTKKQQQSIIGIFALLIIIFIGIKMIQSGTKNGLSEQPKASSIVQQVFDVPSLVGKNIDGVIVALGSPTSGTEPTALQLQSGTTEWDKSWDKNGTSLLVTYNLKTKKVVDFFVGTTDPSGLTKDKQQLLTLTGTREGQSSYVVEFVQALKSPGSYTGIKITPR